MQYKNGPLYNPFENMESLLYLSKLFSSAYMSKKVKSIHLIGTLERRQFLVANYLNIKSPFYTFPLHESY